MSEQPDETSEVVRAGMRTALTLAAQLAQRAVRARRQQLHEREATSAQRAAELQARFDAERSAAVAALTPVGRDDWWATAGQQDIADMHRTARTWEDVDPSAREAANRIRREVDARYGIDPTSLEHAADLDREASTERERGQVDQAAAVAVAIGTDAAADRAEHEGAEPAYAAASEARTDALWDSADRRTDTAVSFEGIASDEAVKGRMLADTGQGKPARSAVTQRSTKSAPLLAGAANHGLAPQQPPRIRRS